MRAEDLKGEITHIREVYKSGAYGDSNSVGRWIYGKRPDGKTVACENEETASGGIRIWSYWESPECAENEIDTCETEFTAKEWRGITKAPKHDQPSVCNIILREREKRS